MSENFTCISPIDSSVVAVRKYLTQSEVNKAFSSAKQAQVKWAKLTLEERSGYIKNFLEKIKKLNEQIVPELAKQMGRPIIFGGEIEPLIERVEYVLKMAPSFLANFIPDNDQPRIKRFIKRDPVGVVLIIAPWNYPFITAINGIVPALLAGNVVVLKHAEQTLLVGERLAEAFSALPEGVFTNLLMTHDQVKDVLQSRIVNHLSFTGSVAGGKAVELAAAGSFTTMNLELGGKDGAYVLADCNFDKTVAALAEGTFYNSGQCCCGIERIYVAKKIFNNFIAAFVNETNKLALGNPLDKSTTLGPMANKKFAKTVRSHIDQAIKKGAKALIDVKKFPADNVESAYIAPQVLSGVDHSMLVMSDETFGPVVGIMPVSDDNEAIKLMNDSKYGLTGSIWTADLELAEAIGRELEVGVVFMNRCDYVDPGLVWTGVKDTGRGASLSKYGFDALTRPKSFHLRADF